MNIKERITQDLKQAMLARDTTLTTTLRGLKSAIGYAEVEHNARQEGLNDQAVTAVLAKEAKKRQESAELYRQGGNDERASQELAEKAVIERYLPAQLDEDQLREIIAGVVSSMAPATIKEMGAVIARVRAQTAGAADGATIARLVKERLA